jgi:hypothetical protein
VLISPPPREGIDGHDDHDEPHQRHPPCGVESHDIAAAAWLRSEVESAPSAVVLETALRGLLCMRHELSLSSGVDRHDTAADAGRRQRRRVESLVAPLSDGMRSGGLA